MSLRCLVVAGAAMLGGCGWFGDDLPSDSEDLAAIDALNRQYLEAINSGDVETLTELTVESHIMIAPNRAPIAGKAANAAALRDLIEQFDIDLSWMPGATALGGDWAWQRGRFIMTATPKAGGEARTSTGHYLRIFARQPEGHWRMTIDMFNTDSPPGD